MSKITTNDINALNFIACKLDYEYYKQRCSDACNASAGMCAMPILYALTTAPNTTPSGYAFLLLAASYCAAIALAGVGYTNLAKTLKISFSSGLLKTENNKNFHETSQYFIKEKILSSNKTNLLLLSRQDLITMFALSNTIMPSKTRLFPALSRRRNAELLIRSKVPHQKMIKALQNVNNKIISCLMTPSQNLPQTTPLLNTSFNSSLLPELVSKKQSRFSLSYIFNTSTQSDEMPVFDFKIEDLNEEQKEIVALYDSKVGKKSQQEEQNSTPCPIPFKTSNLNDTPSMPSMSNISSIPSQSSKNTLYSHK